MNLEQLKLLSDSELNTLAAEKVMGFKFHKNFDMWFNEKKMYESWNPCSDMNDAMELSEKLRGENIFIDLYSNVGGYSVIIEETKTVVHDRKASRAITIASILAKE